ncbi:hypothetical protein IFM89_027655 [Coptis chinensis]|uniref:Uncharacterized protein n=1 Tax=Coptis chinensis TaxID=261450 RepID=A0A835IYQ6_9MAGN|nr:hypothetical protein IFM89_027655 [Coptis chinensis]
MISLMEEVESEILFESRDAEQVLGWVLLLILLWLLEKHLLGTCLEVLLSLMMQFIPCQMCLVVWHCGRLKLQGLLRIKNIHMGMVNLIL